MPLIPLSNGLVTVVDDEDFEWLSAFKWSAVLGRNGCYYANRGVVLLREDGTRRKFSRQMQRDILDPEMLLPRSVKADHRDGDTLNNRRSNLRLASDALSNANRKLFRNNTTGHRNVCWDKEKGRYRVRVGHNGTKLWGGYFAAFEDACRAADELAVRLRGVDATEARP